MERRISSRHPSVRIVPNTYKGLKQQCTFIDAELGEFQATPENVMVSITGGHPQRVSLAKRTTKLARASSQIETRVREASGGRVTLIGPYRGMRRKCLFLDADFGQFEAIVGNVIYSGTRHPNGAPQRRKEAFRARFGVDHHMQDTDQFLKYQESVRLRYIEKNWKTGEELSCIGTWEQKVVQWLNSQQINFRWQSQTFRLPTGKTYRPDLYLTDRDIWVEIKGLWRDESKAKWEWFHATFPNSELWDEERLHGLGIKVSRRKTFKSRS